MHIVGAKEEAVGCGFCVSPSCDCPGLAPPDLALRRHPTQNGAKTHCRYKPGIPAFFFFTDFPLILDHFDESYSEERAMGPARLTRGDQC